MLSCSALGGCVLFGCGLLLGLGSLPGCGGDSPETSAKTDDADSPGQPPGRRVAANDGGDRGRGGGSGQDRREVYTKDGQKWWNNHPYDVWHQDAYAIASDRTPIGQSPDPKKPGDSPEPVPKEKEDPKAKSSSGWESLAGMGELEAEVVGIRNQLTARLRTTGGYNTSYKQVANSGAALAVVAHVISLHPGDVSWKDDALYIRDLGQAISKSATGLGAKNFRETKAPFEQFVDVLNRSKPAGLPEPKPDARFSEFAGRGGLMQRMQEGYNWLDKEVPSAEALKENGDRVKQEAAILAVMLKVVGEPGYEYADDPGYQEYLTKSIELSRELSASVEKEDYKSYRKALSTIYNNCNQCHDGYRE